MDYGNEEVLFCDSLRHLDPKFFQLPYQAIRCDLVNTLPADPSGSWTDEVCEWFTNLLFGSSLRVTVVSCSAPNVIAVEAYLPANHLINLVVANFDLRSEKFGRDSISLTSFMQHTGLSKLTNSSDDHLIVSEVTMTHKGQKEIYFSSISDLPPLVVKLNELKQFACVLSVVSKNMLLYVHPVQESVADNITVLNKMLKSHYSVEENCQAIPTGHLKSGKLCVVYSREFEQWCRSVIVAVQGDLLSGDKLTCLVFFVDYGGSVWKESSQLCTLIPIVCTYPAQVICCDLTGSTGRFVDEGSLNFEVSGTSFCSMEQKLASKCASSVAMEIDNKTLIAAVKVEKGMHGLNTSFLNVVFVKFKHVSFRLVVASQ